MADSNPPLRTTSSGFPVTRWSILRLPADQGTTQEDRRAALEAIARLYWRPIYAVLRLHWNCSPAEAEDLTQDFFLWMLEGPLVERAEPGHGRFRNFVRAHLDHFMMNARRAERRLCRGGGRKPLSLDFHDCPDLVPLHPASATPDEILDREWRRAVLKEGLARLEKAMREEGQGTVFEVLRRYDVDPPPEGPPKYEAVAQQLGIKATDVANYLFRARKRLYEHIREVVAESVDSPEALREELDAMMPKVRK